MNVRFLSQKMIDLATFICQNKTEHSYDILQISRVCEVPKKTEEFVTLCTFYMGSDKNKWVSDSLAAIAKQPKVSYEELTKIFLDLTVTTSR